MKKINIFIFIFMISGLHLSAQKITGTAKRIVVTGYDNTKLEAQTFVFAPKGNAKDILLNIENIMAKLVVEGSDRSDIKLHAEGLLGLPKKAKGLRAVSRHGEDNTKMGINLTQVGNEINLTGTNVKRSRQAVFTITVPKEMALRISYKNWDSENLVIKNVSGGIEAQVSTANVLLDKVTGPLSISTHGGNIDIKYTDVSSEAVTVLSSSSGDIDLTIAESANVDFNINQTSGEIFTDLDIEFKNEVPDKSLKSTVTLGNNTTNLTSEQESSYKLAYTLIGTPKTISKAKLNKGGIRIDINSIAGDVYLRKK